jgi:hypothetical protein
MYWSHRVHGLHYFTLDARAPNSSTLTPYAPSDLEVDKELVLHSSSRARQTSEVHNVATQQSEGEIADLETL